MDCIGTEFEWFASSNLISLEGLLLVLLAKIKWKGGAGLSFIVILNV